MFFNITATITETREVSGRINVSKKDLVEAGYPAQEDGDSSAWYGHVSEFLENEFETNEHDYYISDIEIDPQQSEEPVQEVFGIMIDWE